MQIIKKYEWVKGLYYNDRFPGLFALTFDDGPNKYYTHKILKSLEKLDVKATFFLLLGKVKMHTDLVEHIQAEGHSIGLHGNLHYDIANYPTVSAQSDLIECITYLFEYHGIQIKYYRPPFGSPWVKRKMFHRRRIGLLLKKLNLYNILWTIDPKDYKAISSFSIYERVKKKLYKGGPILFHDNNLNTTNSLTSIVNLIKKEDSEIVPIVKLLRIKYRFLDVR